MFQSISEALKKDSPCRDIQHVLIILKDSSKINSTEYINTNNTLLLCALVIHTLRYQPDYCIITCSIERRGNPSEFSSKFLSTDPINQTNDIFDLILLIPMRVNHQQVMKSSPDSSHILW